MKDIAQLEGSQLLEDFRELIPMPSMQDGEGAFGNILKTIVGGALPFSDVVGIALGNGRLARYRRCSIKPSFYTGVLRSISRRDLNLSNGTSLDELVSFPQNNFLHIDWVLARSYFELPDIRDRLMGTLRYRLAFMFMGNDPQLDQLYYNVRGFSCGNIDPYRFSTDSRAELTLVGYSRGVDFTGRETRNLTDELGARVSRFDNDGRLVFTAVSLSGSDVDLKYDRAPDEDSVVVDCTLLPICFGTQLQATEAK